MTPDHRSASRLGARARHPEAPLEWGTMPAIEPRDFFRTANIKTATAIAMAQHQGLPPEYQVIRQILRENGELEDVNEVYLNDLAKDGVRPSDAGARGEPLATAGTGAETAGRLCRHSVRSESRQHRPRPTAARLEALRIVGGVGVGVVVPDREGDRCRRGARRVDASRIPGPRRHHRDWSARRSWPARRR